jgi:hypothetical protein
MSAEAFSSTKHVRELSDQLFEYRLSREAMEQAKQAMIARREAVAEWFRENKGQVLKLGGLATAALIRIGDDWNRVMTTSLLSNDIGEELPPGDYRVEGVYYHDSHVLLSAPEAPDVQLEVPFETLQIIKESDTII